MTTRKVYIAELEELAGKVNQMGIQLEHMIDQVIKALTDLDMEMAASIIREDDIIDDMERKIERACILLMAKQQPVVATDLRRVTSIMRLISDVERIADHCGDIAEYIAELAREPGISMPQGLLEMFRHMRSMVSRTIGSFIEENIEVVNQIVRDDDVVDEYFDSIKAELITSMKNSPEHMRAYVAYLLIVKYVERMADHATNIAEWVAFIITGDLEEYMNS